MNRPAFLLYAMICGLFMFHAESAADSQRWERDILRFEASDALREPPRRAIVFIGSSSFRMWRTLPRDMSPLAVINRAFGGSTIADCAYYVPRIVTPYSPDAVILYAGDNDIAAGNTPEQALADFRAFVETVLKDLPGATIFFVSIKPSPARWNLWEKMREANKLIEEYTKSRKGLEYIDVAGSMLGQSGSIRPELFISDRLHMNAMGYNIWTSAIKPRLMEFRSGVDGKAPRREP